MLDHTFPSQKFYKWPKHTGSVLSWQENKNKNKKYKDYLFEKENSPKDLPTQTRFGGNTSLSLKSTSWFLQMSVHSSPSIYPTSKMRNNIPNTLTNVLLLDPIVEA